MMKAEISICFHSFQSHTIHLNSHFSLELCADETGPLGLHLVLFVAEDEQRRPERRHRRLRQHRVQVLGHVLELLLDGGAVHHKQEAARAGLVPVQRRLSQPLVAGDVHQIQLALQSDGRAQRSAH